MTTETTNIEQNGQESEVVAIPQPVSFTENTENDQNTLVPLSDFPQNIESIPLESSFSLNANEVPLNSIEAPLNGTQVVLNENEFPLNSSETSLNGSELALNANEAPLKDVQSSLNGSELALNENGVPLSDTDEKGEIQPEHEEIDPRLTEIINFVKEKKTSEKGTVWKIVGIESSLFNELTRITKEGGIPISHYCTFVLQNHMEVLSMQIIKNENVELQQKLNAKENELLKLSMDKNKVQQSAELSSSLADTHLAEKNELKAKLAQAQTDLQKANDLIMSQRKAVENASDAALESYRLYSETIIPNAMTSALRDTYDEIISLIESHRKPKSFETVEDFFSGRMQSYIDLISRQIELSKLAEKKAKEA